MVTLIMVQDTKHNSPFMQIFLDQKTDLSRDQNNKTLLIVSTTLTSKLECQTMHDDV